MDTSCRPGLQNNSREVACVAKRLAALPAAEPEDSLKGLPQRPTMWSLPSSPWQLSIQLSGRGCDRRGEDDGLDVRRLPSSMQDGTGPGPRDRDLGNGSRTLLGFMAPAAAGVLHQPSEMTAATGAFAALCSSASGTYLVKVCLEAESDRHHPIKALRRRWLRRASRRPRLRSPASPSVPFSSGEQGVNFLQTGRSRTSRTSAWVVAPRSTEGIADPLTIGPAAPRRHRPRPWPQPRRSGTVRWRDGDERQTSGRDRSCCPKGSVVVGAGGRAAPPHVWRCFPQDGSSKCWRRSK